MGRHALTFLLILSTGLTFGQGLSTDTVEVKPKSRPHFLYFEAIGRAGYYNLGYGYSFYQREKHELNTTIGAGFLYVSNQTKLLYLPVGLFYRYGEKFKVEAGFSITTILNFPRFNGPYYYQGESRGRLLGHQVMLVPSLGFVYATKNGKFEIGARYTPYFRVEPYPFEDIIPYVFGAFFQYRLKGIK